MKEGRNQKYLRQKNKSKILQLLRRSPMSYSELARSLNLSNTAISNIVNDLIEDGIAERESDMLGRAGIRVKLRKQLGYVIGVDFSKEFSEIVAMTLSNDELFKVAVSFEYKIGEHTFNEIFAVIDGIIEEQKRLDMQLCCISIATPGKINKDTGYFICAPRFQNYQQINLEKLFQERYGCDVLVKNDINLAMEGFRIINENQRELRDAVLIYNGVGLGCALLLNGKVYEGNHGFAGEIGLYTMNLFASESKNLTNFYEQDNYADTTLSLLAIVRAVKKGVAYGMSSLVTELAGKDGQIGIETVIKAYGLGDELVMKVVNAQAIVMARFLKNMLQLLDVESIILDGEITNFGNSYYRVLRGALDCNVELLMSDSSQNLALLGAVEEGKRVALEAKIKTPKSE